MKFDASISSLESAAPAGSAAASSLFSAEPNTMDPDSSTNAATPQTVSTKVDVRSFGIAAIAVAPARMPSVTMIALTVAGSFESCDAARKIREMLMANNATARIAPTGSKNGSSSRSLRSSARFSSAVMGTARPPGRSMTATAVPPVPVSSGICSVSSVTGHPPAVVLVWSSSSSVLLLLRSGPDGPRFTGSPAEAACPF
ncbi:MAG: hypothetical protein ABIP21_02745, partial [Acidimicrobiia bacterium]